MCPLNDITCTKLMITINVKIPNMYVVFEKILIKAHNDLIRKLRGGEFQVVLSQSFNDELTTQLEALKDKEKDIRIILGNFNETWAR